MFKDNLKEFRKSKNLSQEQLGEICDVSRQTISKWESGLMMPEMDKLLILCDYFDTSLDKLIRGKDSFKESTPTDTTVFSFEKICEMILPRRKSMEVLYDADLYDVIYDEKRNSTVNRLWEKFDWSQYGVKTIHDCSIGTGQMTIALAQLGYEVSGSDISQDMLDKCSENASKYGVDIPLTQCDFRELGSHIDVKFDCVMSTGNSLAHVDNKDVVHTLHEMDKLVKDNGYIYFDSRNWDKILAKHQRFYTYYPFFVDDQRINFMQVWDYNLDGTITFNLVYTFEKDNKIDEMKVSSIYYYPISRSFLVEELKKMGYEIIFERPFPNGSISMEDTDWYEVLARKNKTD